MSSFSRSMPVNPLLLKTFARMPYYFYFLIVPDLVSGLLRGIHSSHVVVL